MKQLIIFVTLAVAAYAAKMPVEHVPVTVPVTGVVVESTSVPVVAPHTDKNVHPAHHPVVEHDSHNKVPSHVQHVVEQVHQHVPQVVNHHVGVKDTVQVSPVPHVSGVTDKVPNVGDVTPTVVGVHQHHHTVPQADVVKAHEVEQHVQQVMQQAHQHIPQVINHHVAHHSTTHGPHSVHEGEKVPQVTPVPDVDHHHVGDVVHHPVVTVKTTTM